MESWHLIVGLGNPGAAYAQTRHNAGYQVLHELAAKWRVGWSTDRQLKSELARGQMGERRLLLCRPLTYMNLSGESVAAVMAYYRVPNQQVAVVLDDADLPFGEVRMRPGGGTGGHHGLESIEQHLGSQEYARQRLGIGRAPGEPRQISGYVLGRFTEEERTVWQTVLNRAVEQLECWVRDGLELAMTRFNGAVINRKAEQ